MAADRLRDVLVQVVGSIPVEDASVLSYDRFCMQYMRPNLPVIIRGVTDGWRACREWVTAEGQPDLDRLEELFGSSHVQVRLASTVHVCDLK